MTVSTAPLIESNEQTAAETASGMGCSRSVTSVMTPSVPSDPTNNRVKSYPAADFRARVPVVTTRPSAITTVRPKTFSRIVPYRTAVVPDARVAAMPPMVASAPGSIGNASPLLRSALFTCSRVMPACTVTSRSSTLRRSTRFISRRSIVIPPRTAWT
jgi:hypothetical protein